MKIILSVLTLYLSVVVCTQVSAQNEADSLASIKITNIKFETEEFKFGVVKQGQKVRHAFHFRNTGKYPLKISDAKGSSSSLSVKWPNEPILPGKTGEIEVVFDTKEKYGDQTKMVTIFANVDSGRVIIYMKGKVLE